MSSAATRSSGAVAERVPAILAWVVSFVYVLVFWVAHHYLFAQLANVDRGLLWLNGLFLLAISITPFPTSLAGEYPGATPAVFMLSLAMFRQECIHSIDPAAAAGMAPGSI